MYNFHFYAPLVFTHQGATWGWGGWAPLHSLPYPSSPELCATVLPQIDEQARHMAIAYCEERWNRERLEQVLAPAFEWAERHGVPLVVNEFGVHRAPSLPEARHAYLKDLREVLEAHGVGWTMWSYADGFGLTVYDPATRRHLIEPDTAAALGLNVAAIPSDHLATLKEE